MDDDSLTPKIPVEIVLALLKVQKGLQPFTKSADNTEFDSKFTPLPVVMTQALKLLNKQGVAVIQSPTLTAEGASAFKTTLVHKSGVSYSDITKLAIERINPQSHASAITYMRRYQLMAMLGLTSEDDDDDGNRASGVSGKATEEQREQITSLLRHLKRPVDQIAREQRNIRTYDHAAKAIINFEQLVSQTMREREAEGAALGAEASTTHIAVTDDEPTITVEQRVKNLLLKDKATENKLVHTITGKPFLKNCTPEDLFTLSKTLDKLESGATELPDEWYAAGHPATKTTAADTVEGQGVTS